MRTLIVALLGVSLVAVVACKPKQQGPTPDQIAQEKVSQALQAGGDSDTASARQVQVAPKGTHFKPPVRVDQLPDGVWYCDMGTVHYARPEKGDGRCPICGMELTKR